MRRRTLVLTAGAVIAGSLALHSAADVDLEPPRAAPPPARAQANALRAEITPVADTTIWSSPVGVVSPMPPLGDEPVLETGFQDSGVDREALLRFALPTTVPDMALAYADLTLHIRDATYGIATPHAPPASGRMRLSLQTVLEPWSEEGLASPSLPRMGEPRGAAQVPWGPCQGGGCGTARIDAWPLLAGLQRRGDEAAVLDLDIGQPAPILSEPPGAVSFADMDFDSREGEHPPLLRLLYQPILVDPPLDLRGSAGYSCATRQVDVTIHNDGGGDLLVPFYLEADEDPPRRLLLPGPIRAGEARTYTDEGWRRGTWTYRIDPEGRLPELDPSNNEVSIAVPECPTSGATPPPGRSYLPAALDGR